MDGDLAYQTVLLVEVSRAVETRGKVGGLVLYVPACNPAIPLLYPSLMSPHEGLRG